LACVISSLHSHPERNARLLTVTSEACCAPSCGVVACPASGTSLRKGAAFARTSQSAKRGGGAAGVLWAGGGKLGICFEDDFAWDAGGGVHRSAAVYRFRYARCRTRCEPRLPRRLASLEVVAASGGGLVRRERPVDPGAPGRAGDAGTCKAEGGAGYGATVGVDA
jgi:hypothetical protein